MADSRDGSQFDDLPQAQPAPKRGWVLPLVWFIPLIAALVGGWLGAHALLARGPTVTINFRTAEGIEAGKTKIKYKNVDIGEVTGISLADDRASVLVKAELTPQADGFLVEDSRFWVVRPRIAAGGVSGLGTLLSGSFIGVDAGKSSQRRTEFVGLEVPPVITADRPGRQFVLRGDDLGSLDFGSPVYFRRVQVGQVVGYELDKGGEGITLRVFVQAPYDQFVNENSRFWHASGIDISLDASGVTVDTQSLASIVLGGIAFETPSDLPVGKAAAQDATFTLNSDRAQAMRTPDTVSRTYVLVFKESVRGLSPGAPVDFRGVVVGEVMSIGAQFDPVKRDFTIPVEIRLYPGRFRSRYQTQTQTDPAPVMDSQQLVERLVERGWRAQLRPGNLLTGQLYVALDFFPNAPKAKADFSKSPPELPTIPGSLQELQTTIAQIAKNIEKVPFEQIAAELRTTLASLDRTLRSVEGTMKRVDTELTPEARAAIEDMRRTLGTAERTFANAEQALDARAPLQQDLRDTLHELSRAAQALRVLADYLERHPESLVRGKPEEKP